MNLKKLFDLIHSHPQHIVATYGYSQSCHVWKISRLSSEWVWYVHSCSLCHISLCKSGVPMM